jgi:exodeoxyribonuclease V beta subunit
MNFFTFPRGAHPGIFLHELFEKLDFSKGLSDINDGELAESLEKHGFKSDWLPHIRLMLENVLTTSLAAPDGDFSLSDLQQGSWLSELEFFFPLKFITSSILRATFSRWSSQYTALDLLALSQSLRFKPAEGMVRGFIDMVFEHNGRFYLLDWKSNHLGYRIEDYCQEALKNAMGENLYPLQYLLYTVALNRYLSLRVRGYDYTTHFGGVFYFFLRGVNRERGEKFGIFRDIPPVEMINELTECLIKAGG